MLAKLKGLVTDSLTYGISKVLSQIVGFFLLPLYTSYLTPADYGVLAMLAILTALFSPLSGLGMTNAIFRRYNLTKDEGERRQVLGVGMLSVVVASLLLLLVGSLLSGPLAELLTGNLAYTNLVGLTLVTAALQTIGEVPRAIMRAQRQVRRVAALNVIDVLVAIGLTIFFVVGLRRGVQGVIEANLIAALESLILNILVNLRGTYLLFERATWRRMLSYGLPFIPHRLLSFGLAQYGQYMIGTLLGLEQAGLYSLAVRVTSPISFVVGSIQQAWVPYKFQIQANDPHAADFFRSATTYYIILTSYLWVGASVWGPEVVRLMTTVDFHEAALIIPMAAFIPISQGYYFMFGTGIELTDNTKFYPVVSLIGLLGVVFTSGFFIQLWGAKGAALSTGLGGVLMAIVVYIYANKLYKIQYDWVPIALILITTCLLIFVSISAQNYNLALRITLGLGVTLVFPLSVGLILLLSKHERERVNLVIFRTKELIGKFIIKNDLKNVSK